MKRKFLALMVGAVCMAMVPMTAAAEETSILDALETEETEEVELVRPDYTASDYVTLGEYKGLSVTVTTQEITDELVYENAKTQLSYYGTIEMDSITEGTVENGDTTVIDYEGKKDGVAFEGGTAQGQELVIGSDSFIDGFEDGLIGVAIGETVDLNLTFPENYGAADLAGQDVVFTVTVHEVKRMPELTDELVSTTTEGSYETLDDYLAYTKTSMEEEQEMEKESSIIADLMAQIVENVELSEYPQDVIDYYVADGNAYYNEMAEMYGMELEDFISTYFGMTKEIHDEQLLLSIQQGLLQEMTINAIAEAEGLEVDEEAYEAKVTEYMETYGFESKEALIEAVGDEASLKYMMVQENVLDFLIENAVIEEVTE